VIFRPIGSEISPQRGPSPTATRARVVPAPQLQVWELVADPGQMSRWWPGVQRVEGVEDGRFTQVFVSRRGRTVRMDYQVVASEPPWRRAWAQEVTGTPFERVLSECVIEVMLSPVAGGTQVTLAERQRLKGYSRTGGLLLARASARRLDQALAGLEGPLSLGVSPTGAISRPG
jgi:uncharacterized protein YndB with AHSA1/START domain